MGFDPDPFEQYVALAKVAGTLTPQGVIVAANEAARTSLPGDLLTGAGSSMDVIALLRELPLPYLYCGFVKHEVDGVRGVWMRTYGAPRLGLPDLAVHAQGHHEGQRYFDVFDNVLAYLRTSGKRFRRGDTLQVGSQDFMRVRAPHLSETFLEREGDLWVIEMIRPDEVNE